MEPRTTETTASAEPEDYSELDHHNNPTEPRENHMAFSRPLPTLPAGIRQEIFKGLMLQGWRGRNALCHLEILQGGQNGIVPENGFEVVANELFDLVSRNRDGAQEADFPVSMEAARNALSECRPMYVLLYSDQMPVVDHAYTPYPMSFEHHLYPALGTGLPADPYPQEAFIDLLSHGYYSTQNVLQTVANVFGSSIRHIYLLHPYHTFNTSCMDTLTDDDVTMREYALRSPQPDNRFSLVNNAINVLLGTERLNYSPDRILAAMFKVGGLTPENTRVVQSQATGEEFAEIWRQELDGMMRLEAFHNQLWYNKAMFRWLRRIVMNLLMLCQEETAVLPDLQSVSIMTVSKKTNTRVRPSLRSQLEELGPLEFPPEMSDWFINLSKLR